MTAVDRLEAQAPVEVLADWWESLPNQAAFTLLVWFWNLTPSNPILGEHPQGAAQGEYWAAVRSGAEVLAIGKRLRALGLHSGHRNPRRELGVAIMVCALLDHLMECFGWERQAEAETPRLQFLAAARAWRALRRGPLAAASMERWATEVEAHQLAQELTEEDGPP